jgi:MerR family transcriptional regulator, heat shock protein HspR
MDKYPLEIRFMGDEWVRIESLGYNTELLGRLTELGVIELHGDHIHVTHVIRLRKYFRLRSTLGVNTSGAAVILDLLERIEQLQHELRCLRGE